MKAADIMSTNVVTIDRMASISAAARLMQQKQVRALIVNPTSDRDAYGIITTTDISRSVAKAKNPEATYICEVMTEPCITVNPDLPVELIPKLFARAKIRVAPVIKDKLLGIVSITDLLTKTDCLTAIKANLTPEKIAELAELPLDELISNEFEIDCDRIRENWCSG